MLEMKEISFGYSNESVRSLYAAFRGWWRLLDAVENEAAEKGQEMTRVEDVRLLQPMHAEFALKIRMRQPKFNLFISCANSVRKNLGSPILYWKAPRAQTPRRDLPPENQVHALRVALKQTWEAVRRNWARLDGVRAEGFSPQSEEEARLLRHWLHFNAKQQANNRRSSRKLEYRGATYSWETLAKEFGINVSAMMKRVARKHSSTLEIRKLPNEN